MIRKSGRVFVAAIAAVAVLIAGCSEDNTPPPPKETAIVPEEQAAIVEEVEVIEEPEPQTAGDFFDELSESVEDTKKQQVEQAIEEKEDVFAFDDSFPEIMEDEQREVARLNDATALIGRNMENAGGLDGKELPPFIDIPAIEQDRFNALYRSWEVQKPFMYQSFSAFQAEDGARVVDEFTGRRPWNEWPKNFISVMTDFHYITLFFKKAGNVEVGESDKNFHIRLRFDEKRLVIDRGSFYSGGLQLDQQRKIGHTLLVKHSLPKTVYEQRGFRIPMFLGTFEQAFIPGIDHSGVMIFIPAQKKNGPRGVLLCPRDYDVWKMQSGFAHLEDSGYRLEQVQFELVSLAQARVLTGFGPGVAKVSVQTTDNIAAPILVEEESTSLYPFVSVKYEPIKGGIKPDEFLNGEISAGARVMVDLHNSFEHYARSTIYLRTTLKEIQFKKNERIKLNERTFNIKPGLCYGLIKEWQTVHHFAKEPLPVAVTGGPAVSDEDNLPEGIPPMPRIIDQGLQGGSDAPEEDLEFPLS